MNITQECFFQTQTCQGLLWIFGSLEVTKKFSENFQNNLAVVQ